jgi:hypothetical protein
MADRSRSMQRLYEITIPGLSMRADFPAVRHRLLADFPDVAEVLAMTTPGTVLVMYRGEHEVDAWLDALSDSVATRRMSLGRGRTDSAGEQVNRSGGPDSAGEQVKRSPAVARASCNGPW